MKEKFSDILKPETGCISEDILFRYAQGKLSADEVRRVEAHLADCDFCSDALEGIMTGDLEKSKAAIAEIKKKIQERGTGKKISPLRRVMQIAAVIMLLAVSGWFVNLLIQKPSEKIFTEQFQPYPAPQNENSIQSIPPSVSESNVSSDTDITQPGASTFSNAKPEAEKNHKPGKKSPESPVTQTLTDKEFSPAAKAKSADAPAENNVVQQDQSKDSVLSFSAAEKNETKSAAGMENQSRNATSLNEVVTDDAASSDRKIIMKNFDKGMKYYKGNRYAEAIAEFELVLLQEPNNADANFYSGVSSLALHHPEEALKYFKKTEIKGSQFYEATLWYEALSYINMGDKKQAKNLLKKLIDLDGEYKARGEETLKQL